MSTEQLYIVIPLNTSMYQAWSKVSMMTLITMRVSRSEWHLSRFSRVDAKLNILQADIHKRHLVHSPSSAVFMPPPNVVSPFLSCLSVRPSRNIINTISCTVFDTLSPNLHQWCTVGHRWLQHNLRSKGQGHGRIKYAGNSTSGLVNMMSWKESDFHQTYINDVLWDRDECIKFQGQKVKVQGHSVITYAGNVTAQVEAYGTWRLMSRELIAIKKINAVKKINART